MRLCNKIWVCYFLIIAIFVAMLFLIYYIIFNEIDRKINNTWQSYQQIPHQRVDIGRLRNSCFIHLKQMGVCVCFGYFFSHSCFQWHFPTYGLVHKLHSIRLNECHYSGSSFTGFCYSKIILILDLNPSKWLLKVSQWHCIRGLI